MEASAPKERSAFPASFVLPMDEDAGSIEGWLEVDDQRVAFRNGAGLELRMRLDSLARVSIPSSHDPDGGADEPIGPPGSTPGTSEAGSSSPERARRGAEAQLGVMRLAGDCGPAQVSWDLLISPGDAKTLGQELAVALGDDDIVTDVDHMPDVIALSDDSWLDDELSGRARTKALRTGAAALRATAGARRLLVGPSVKGAGGGLDGDRRAMIIRRRRVVAAMLITVAFVVAIEIILTAFILG